MNMEASNNDSNAKVFFFGDPLVSTKNLDD